METLKNLVLPGAGSFTIHDSAIVSEADLGVNFFLEEQHLGGHRAEHTYNCLKELNPDVEGHYVTEARHVKLTVGVTNSQASPSAHGYNSPTSYAHIHYSSLLRQSAPSSSPALPTTQALRLSRYSTSIRSASIPTSPYTFHLHTPLSIHTPIQRLHLISESCGHGQSCSSMQRRRRLGWRV